jgi:hypothetical protein
VATKVLILGDFAPRPVPSPVQAKMAFIGPTVSMFMTPGMTTTAQSRGGAVAGPGQVVNANNHQETLSIIIDLTEACSPDTLGRNDRRGGVGF